MDRIPHEIISYVNNIIEKSRQNPKTKNLKFQKKFPKVLKFQKKKIP